MLSGLASDALAEPEAPGSAYQSFAFLTNRKLRRSMAVATPTCWSLENKKVE